MQGPVSSINQLLTCLRRSRDGFSRPAYGGFRTHDHHCQCFPRSPCEPRCTMGHYAAQGLIMLHQARRLRRLVASTARCKQVLGGAPAASLHQNSQHGQAREMALQ